MAHQQNDRASADADDHSSESPAQNGEDRGLDSNNPDFNRGYGGQSGYGSGYSEALTDSAGDRSDQSNSNRGYGSQSDQSSGDQSYGGQGSQISGNPPSPSEEDDPSKRAVPGA